MDKQTDATERPTHAGGYAGVGNKIFNTVYMWFLFNRTNSLEVFWGDSVG